MDGKDTTIPAFAPAQTAERERTLSLLRERILAFAASRMSREGAEDLTQEVMLLLHQKYAQVQALDELVPLALRILRFKMAAQYRKAHRRGEDTAVPVEDIPLPGEEPDPETLSARKELAGRLAAAVRKLPDRCKELLRLKLEGRTFPEIQEHFGAKSVNTVYTWDFRCRKQLLDLMGGSWEPKAPERPRWWLFGGKLREQS